MRKAKTHKVTEMGRLVTRQQLQNAANQIAAHLVRALEKVQAENTARLTRIEHELGLGPKQGPLPEVPLDPERTLALVPDVAEMATDGGEGDEVGSPLCHYGNMEGMAWHCALPEGHDGDHQPVRGDEVVAQPVNAS